MTARKKKGSFAIGAQPQPPGFTWELFFIGIAWVSAFSVLAVVLIWFAAGATPRAFVGRFNYYLWAVFVYFTLIFILTVWLSNIYRRRQTSITISAEDLLTQDTRSHVLYLRPFKDDETTSRFLVLTSEEQNLATVLNEIGPFITIGEPGEEFADPGAARMYVEDEYWQARVKELMASARLVVARLGNSESFWWEISQARRLVAPEQLLLLVPEKKGVYEQLRPKLTVILRSRMPDYKHGPPLLESMKSFLSIVGIIYFERDWTSHLQTFKTSSLRQTFWNPGVPILKTALQPVYQQLSLDWKQPRLQIHLLVVLVALLCLGVVAMYAMVLMLFQMQ